MRPEEATIFRTRKFDAAARGKNAMQSSSSVGLLLFFLSGLKRSGPGSALSGLFNHLMTNPIEGAAGLTFRPFKFKRYFDFRLTVLRRKRLFSYQPLPSTSGLLLLCEQRKSCQTFNNLHAAPPSPGCVAGQSHATKLRVRR
jgi:hypothetical protein